MAGVNYYLMNSSERRGWREILLNKLIRAEWLACKALRCVFDDAALVVVLTMAQGSDE